MAFCWSTLVYIPLKDTRAGARVKTQEIADIRVRPGMSPLLVKTPPASLSLPVNGGLQGEF